MIKKNSPQEMCELSIGKIEEILKHQDDFRRNYGDKGGKIVVDAFGIMRDQIRIASREVKVDATDAEKSLVREALGIMLDVVLYKPIVDMVRDLSLEFSRLAYNWSQQVGPLPDVERSTRLLERLLRAQKTLDDTILVAGKLVDRLHRETSRRPVAYELSKHYLDSINFPAKQRCEATEAKPSP